MIAVAEVILGFAAGVLLWGVLVLWPVAKTARLWAVYG